MTTPEKLQPGVSAWFDAIGASGQAELIGNAVIAVPAVLAIVVTAIVASRQFRHERTEKRKDRAFEARKEILMESVRGASRLLGSINRLSDMSQTVSSILESFQRANEQLTVGYAVASIDTVKRARDLMNAAGPVFIDGLVKRIPLDDIKREIDMHQSSLDHQMADNKAILNMQRDAIAAVNQPDSAKVLNELFQAGDKYFKEIAAERNEAMERMGEAQMLYSRGNFERCIPLHQKLRDYIASVRLDIELDEGNSRPFLDASYVDPAKPIAALDDAFEKLNRGH